MSDISIHNKMFDDLFDSEMDRLFSEDTETDIDSVYEGGKEPVDIIEFIESPEFLNLKSRVYNKVKDLLWQVEKEEKRESYWLLGKGSGKCFTEDQFVLTPKGYIKSKYLKPSSYKEGFSDFNIDLINKDNLAETTSHFYSNGVHEVLELTLDDGSKFTATPNHPVMVFTDRGFEWKPLSNLSIDDEVVSLRRSNIFGQTANFNYKKIFTEEEISNLPSSFFKKLDYSLIKIISLFLSFGYKEKEVSVIYLPFNRIEEVKKLLECIPNSNIFYKEDCAEVFFADNCYEKLFEYIGLDVSDMSKVELPKEIFVSSEVTQKFFIKTLFEYNAFIHNKTNDHILYEDDFSSEIGVRIDFIHCSENLVRQLQLLLKNFGIFSKIFKRMVVEGEPDFGVNWVLSITEGHSLSIFRDNNLFISFNRNNYLNSLSFMDYDEVLTNNSNFILNLEHLSGLDLGRTLSYHTALYDVMPRLSVCLDTCSLIKDLIFKYKLNKVREIVSIGKKYTLDFTLPKTHSFIVNGIINHNTTGLTLYMSYGIYKALCLKNPQDYYGLIPGDALAALIVSVSEKQAKDVGFARTLNLLKMSRWFDNKFEYSSKEIKFPKNITFYCGHSGATSWLGYNTFRAAMDETEWMVDSNNRSVARELYRALKGSLNTRYPDKYKLLCISSPKNEYSFLNTLFKGVKETGRKVDLDERLNFKFK